MIFIKLLWFFNVGRQVVDGRIEDWLYFLNDGLRNRFGIFGEFDEGLLSEFERVD